MSQCVVGTVVIIECYGSSGGASGNTGGCGEVVMG